MGKYVMKVMISFSLPRTGPYLSDQIRDHNQHAARATKVLAILF
jgi:hypothetical protein